MKAQIREVSGQDVILLMPENPNEALELYQRQENVMAVVPLGDGKTIVPAPEFFGGQGAGSWCVAVPLVGKGEWGE